MARSILGTVGLAVTVAFAVPIVLFGVDALLSGDTFLGAAFLGVALLMVLVEEHLTTPMDIPGKVAEKTVGAVAADPEESSREE